MWLSSELPEKWKPDRCKFVLTEQASLNRVQVAVDCNFPDAWRKEPFYTQFRLWARQGTIVSVFVGDRVTHLLPNGEEKVGKQAKPSAATSAEVAEIALMQSRK